MKKDIRELELHEKIKINATTEVMKVYGGWIYLHYDLINNNWLKQTTFVSNISDWSISSGKKFIPPVLPTF